MIQPQKTTMMRAITTRSLGFWSALRGDFILAASRSGSLFASHIPVASLHPMKRAMNTHAWDHTIVPAGRNKSKPSKTAKARECAAILRSTGRPPFDAGTAT